MHYETALTATDLALAESKIRDFVPDEVYDIHAHLYRPQDFGPAAWPFVRPLGMLDSERYRKDLRRYLPSKIIHSLFFGMPEKTARRPEINAWMAQEARREPLSRALLLVSPADDPTQVAEQLRSGTFCGIKVYHCYASRPDTMNALVEEFAPEWMWEILDEVQGVMLLHLVRDGAIDDPQNQLSLRRLCRRYPRARLILAHIARSFNYRNARSGLHRIADLDNAVVDTSAICEADTFREALKILGPRRVLWGSDFPVSELRGRCVTTGNRFLWLHPDSLRSDHVAPTSTDLTLVGIESLLSLREACEDGGLTAGDVADVFLQNSLRTLQAHLPPAALPVPVSGPALWQEARQIISCGTGLQSKRAEMFDPQNWPSYFSRASGCEVWDLEGRRYLDFAGGIGAVLLGYADPDVTAAVQRRLALGTYCTLVNPQEVELAQKLLALHPWAGKVRYARGGGEAMGMSVRIARAATGKSGVAFCGYHGWHDWYLAANLGESSALDGHLIPGLEPKGVPRELAGTSVPFRYNDLGSLDRALDKLKGNLAAVVMEPMRSQLPVDDFVARVAEKCRAAGAVFIVDEVTSGLRHGFPGAIAEMGIAPDVAVYAKAYSNGIPFGVVIGKTRIMEAAESSFISSSYWTDAIGTTAALAVLDKVQRINATQQIREKGRQVHAALQEIARRFPACRLVVDGMPATPHLSFDLGDDGSLALTLYIRKMRERGILAFGTCYLMLAHQQSHLDRYLAAVAEVLGEIEPLVIAGRLEESAGVPRGRRGFARLA